jgi:hypothetical protein
MPGNDQYPNERHGKKRPLAILILGALAVVAAILILEWDLFG